MDQMTNQSQARNKNMHHSNIGADDTSFREATTSHREHKTLTKPGDDDRTIEMQVHVPKVKISKYFKTKY